MDGGSMLERGAQAVKKALERAQFDSSSFFLPPVQPSGGASAGRVKPPQMFHLEGQLRQARAHQAQVTNHKRILLQVKEHEMAALRALVASQRETIESQKAEMWRLDREVINVQKVSEAELATVTARAVRAEKSLTGSSRRFSELALEHEKALQAASAALARALAERNAIALAFSAVAGATLGGAAATAASVSEDNEAALESGKEPVSRSAQTWLNLKFGLDASNNLVTMSSEPGSRQAPYDNDGARAVTALIAGVSRLYSRCAASRAEIDSLQATANELQQLNSRMASSVATAYGTIDEIEHDLSHLQEAAIVSGLELTDTSALDLPSRVLALQGYVSHLARALVGTTHSSQRAMARAHELEFYSQLQTKVVHDAHARRHRILSLREESAIMIQKNVRGFMVRSHLRRAHMAAKLVQSKLRATMALRRAVSRRLTMSETMQRQQDPAMDIAQLSVATEEEAAATQLQAAARGYLTRKSMTRKSMIEGHASLAAQPEASEESEAVDVQSGDVETSAAAVEADEAESAAAALGLEQLPQETLLLEASEAALVAQP